VGGGLSSSAKQGFPSWPAVMDAFLDGDRRVGLQSESRVEFLRRELQPTCGFEPAGMTGATRTFRIQRPS